MICINFQKFRSLASWAIQDWRERFQEDIFWHLQRIYRIFYYSRTYLHFLWQSNKIWTPFLDLGCPFIGMIIGNNFSKDYFIFIILKLLLYAFFSFWNKLVHFKAKCFKNCPCTRNALEVLTHQVALGIYWSVSAYIDWQGSPVLTTVATTAFAIKHIEFPALTICAPGIIFSNF